MNTIIFCWSETIYRKAFSFQIIYHYVGYTWWKFLGFFGKSPILKWNQIIPDLILNGMKSFHIILDYYIHFIRVYSYRINIGNKYLINSFLFLEWWIFISQIYFFFKLIDYYCLIASYFVDQVYVYYALFF